MITYLVYGLLLLVSVALNALAHVFLNRRWQLWLVFGVCAAGMMLYVWKTSEPPNFAADFEEAYFAGRLILQKPNQLYDKLCVDGFANIPVVALLFAPFSLFDQDTAYLLMSTLGGLAVLTTLYLLFRLTLVAGYKRIALAGLFVINGALYNSLREGNTSHFVLLLLVAATFLLERKREFWCGMLLAAAAAIKLPLLLLGILFFLRGRWRIVAGFSGALLTIVGASLFLYGVDLHLTWYQRCVQPFAGEPLAAFNVQSVDGFLARLLIDNVNLTYWRPIPVGWDFKVMRYVLLSLLIGGTAWISWRSKPPATPQSGTLEFSIVLCLALVASPISWTHYYLFLLLPASLYLGNKLAVPHGWLWSSLVGLSILLTSLPVVRIAPPDDPVLRFLTSRLFISHYFFGGLLWLTVMLAARWQSSRHAEPSRESVHSPA